MSRLKIIGVGPGTPEYLTPIARRAIEHARVLVGGRRHLKQYAAPDQEILTLKGNLAEAAAFIRARLDRGVVVLASGDPGLYGVLDFLRRHFSPAEIEVIPGISAAQLACARLALPWQDAVFLSAHGRDPRVLVETIRLHPKVVVFTWTKAPPSLLAQLMHEYGISGRKIYCCTDLGYPEEKIAAHTPDTLRHEEIINDNCMLVIVDEKRLALSDSGDS